MPVGPVEHDKNVIVESTTPAVGALCAGTHEATTAGGVSVSDAADAPPDGEYLWRLYYTYEPMPGEETSEWRRWIVTRRTPKFVFVSAADDPGTPLFEKIASYRLDREVLERDGEVRHRGTRATYHLRRPVPQAQPPAPLPAALERFALDATATEADVRRAYHSLALVYHPDCKDEGCEGSEENFRLLNEDYQAALRWVRS